MRMIPPLLAGLCDDAALFPPGAVPLAVAVPAHFAHTDSAYADLVGPLVLPATRLAELAAVLGGRVLPVSLTVPGGTDAAAAALGRLRTIDAVHLVGLEIAVPDGQPVPALLRAVSKICGAAPGVAVHVEVPRDRRRDEVLTGLADLGARAKIRTGGVVADAYPDEAELAAVIAAAGSLGVPFKATAGLHRAVRNTDADTGFEQHGFLNLMLATRLAADGADPDTVAAALADRDGPGMADTLAGLTEAESAAVRRRFVSFGTCSIAAPLADLTALGLVHPPGIPAADERAPA
ncbi:hypothetical protein ACFWQG_19825 [Rhodococcus sp. NPDC058532]|uniref:hypothetical protein n=1 Tax=Rhodococcus sp. NPDC058532 TaxID=3346540 RepID=UPI003662C364